MDETTRHRTSRSLLVALASTALLVLASCSSSKPQTSSTTVVPAATTAASTATTTATTAAAGGATTTEDTAVDEPATTNAPAVAAPANADGSVTVKVAIGTDDFDTSGGKRVVGIKKGTTLTIELTDPAIDEQYHLHGYDLEVEAAKGATGKMTFTADETGQFDLESHTTTKTLLVLLVS